MSCGRLQHLFNMFRVRAIPSEPTRFFCSSNTIVCDNPECSKAYNRNSRHQTVLGRREPTEYLSDGDPCPRCAAKHELWKEKCRRLIYSMALTMAQKEDAAFKLSKGEPVPGVTREPVRGTMKEREHLVDLSGYSNSGQCSCEFFQCVMEPLLKNEPTVVQAVGQHRCQHIHAVRSWALDLALRCHELDRYKDARGQREENVA